MIQNLNLRNPDIPLVEETMNINHRQLLPLTLLSILVLFQKPLKKLSEIQSGRKLWMRRSQPSRKMRHGKGVRYRTTRKLLGVSECSQLSIMMMGPSRDTKPRLVAKGYTQTYRIDYSETFSPVAKIDTIWVLFSIVANEDWPLYQFDVKNAFLHGKIEEEVYMKPPPGFSDEYN